MNTTYHLIPVVAPLGDIGGSSVVDAVGPEVVFAVFISVVMVVFGGQVVLSS